MYILYTVLAQFTTHKITNPYFELNLYIALHFLRIMSEISAKIQYNSMSELIKKYMCLFPFPIKMSYYVLLSR